MMTFLGVHNDINDDIPSSPDPSSQHQGRQDTYESMGATKRSSLNNTTTNFFPDFKSKKKEELKEMHRQQSLGEAKNTNGDTESFSFTFYSSKNRSVREEQREYGTNELPAIRKSKEYESGAPSVGFKLDDNLIKQGVTLDKLFGGEFKKINIFEVKQDVLNTHDAFPDSEGTFETVRGEKYKYESFEIVETENEEDVESRQTQRHKVSAKQTDTSTPATNNNEMRSSGVVNKIESKYKRSKSKSLQRKKSQAPSGSENTLAELPEYKKVAPFEDDKLESRSLSPKFGQAKRRNSKNHTTKPGRARPENTETEQESLGDSQISYTKKSNPLATFHIEKKNRMLISSVTFGNVRENTGSDGNKPGSIKQKKSLLKKSGVSLNPSFLAEHENMGVPQHGLPSMPSSKSGGMGNGGKFSVNPIPAHLSLNSTSSTKADETHSFKQKLFRENKIIAEKIKLHEKEKMDRYSKMFKLNDQEKIKLYQETERKERAQRNSTPFQDLNFEKPFERKRLINF